MAARGPEKTVGDIFRSMEFGPATPSSRAAAQAWLEHRSHSLGLFIGGEFVRPADGQTSVVTDAAGGSVCSTACAGDEDVAAAVAAASGAFKVWSGLTCPRRARVLQRLGDGLQRHSQCLAELCEMTRCPCPASALVRLAQYYAGWAQLRDAVLPGWSPLGVVAVLVSDDRSLFAAFLKVFPALAVGNAVVLKPGAGTAPPALLMAAIFGEAGLPAGVFNIVTGPGVSLGVRLAQTPDVNYVTYSGSKKEAELLVRETAGSCAPVSLSLLTDAICPFIVFDSADVDSAVDAVMEAVFGKARECHWVLCVQESIWEGLAARLKVRIAGAKCLPLRSESDRHAVNAAVQEAQQQGAEVIQPCPAPSSSSLYPPTVLLGVAPSCPSVVSPPPGPILPVLSFRTATEGVTLGNHTPHGLAASVWTEDLTLALETARSLSVGSVWLNSHSVLDPSLTVSGVKESGNCTDGGREGLFQFLRPSVAPARSPSSPLPLDYGRFGTTGSGVLLPQAVGGADASRAPRSYPQLVGGRQCAADSGCSLQVLAPGGSVIALCPSSGRKDVRNAVEAALKVQPGWAASSVPWRSRTLRSLAESLERRGGDVAVALSAQTGCSKEEACREVELSVFRLSEWAAHCETRAGGGGAQALPQSGMALCLPEPLGVIGAVLPDAKPLLSLISLLGAAVAAGNAVVMVPSEKSPLPALEFVQVLQASDVPGGVVSIVSGHRDQLTRALANHSVVQAVWYCGGQEGAQYLQWACGESPKRLWVRSEDSLWERCEAALLEELWAQAVRWKSVWIPTA
ncbi:aldehyde dehydrogenase family 16 member A1 [Scleropages formosus]|uniref:Aldehyde dehydrogenase 16 family, member A1 n=1 Tax=Scleropages formosus TaxID=113540 RepID=A0A8C9TL08_SCLFO|nr:aldehyde dehydrogenase family 16 member A1 [Scleropages formosus]